MIHKIFLIVLFSFCLFSCNTNNHETTNEEVYVIKYKDFNNVDSDTIMLYVEYYFDYNIILFDSISDIYYHKKRWLCMTGTKFNGNLPYFRSLQPKYFVKDDDLDKIKESVLAGILSDSTKTSPNWVGLIYNKDTIRDKRYFELKEFFTNHNIGVSTRKTTEEEDEILKSIMSGKKYEPHLLEWKKTSDAPNDF